MARICADRQLPRAPLLGGQNLFPLLQRMTYGLL